MVKVVLYLSTTECKLPLKNESVSNRIHHYVKKNIQYFSDILSKAITPEWLYEKAALVGISQVDNE